MGSSMLPAQQLEEQYGFAPSTSSLSPHVSEVRGGGGLLHALTLSTK